MYQYINYIYGNMAILSKKISCVIVTSIRLRVNLAVLPFPSI